MLGVIVTLILGSMVTGFLSFIAMFKPWSRLWLTTPNRAAESSPFLVETLRGS